MESPKIMTRTSFSLSEFSNIPLAPHPTGQAIEEPSPISYNGDGAYSTWRRNSDVHQLPSELYYHRYMQDLNLPELAGRQIGPCGVLSPDEFRSATQGHSHEFEYP